MNTRVTHVYTGVGAVLIVAFLTQGPLVAGAIEVSVTASAAAAVFIGIRRNRTKRPHAWHLFALSMLLFAVEQASWVVNLLRHATVTGSAERVVDLAGYLALLAGAVVTLRARARSELGGVLDAAVLAVAGGTVTWEFLLQPQLTTRHATVWALTVFLTQFLLLAASLGVLVRLAQTSARSRATVLYLLAAACGGFVEVLGYPIVNRTAGHVPGSAVETAGMLAVLCIGAAALHPSMAQLTEPGAVVPDRLSNRALLTLGAAMITGPISVGVWELLGHPADLVLLIISPISTVPLVMFRVCRLVTQRATA
ncbi:MAG: hypothetical protein DLM59_18655, partial [Pseudonocardiales bacterium]